MSTVRWLPSGLTWLKRLWNHLQGVFRNPPKHISVNDFSDALQTLRSVFNPKFDERRVCVGANPNHGTSSVIPSHVKGKQKRKKEAQDRKMIWSICGLGVERVSTGMLVHVRPMMKLLQVCERRRG